MFWRVSNAPTRPASPTWCLAFCWNGKRGVRGIQHKVHIQRCFANKSQIISTSTASWNINLTHIPWYKVIAVVKAHPPPPPCLWLLSYPQQGSGKQPAPVLVFRQRSHVGIQLFHITVGIRQPPLYHIIRCDVLEGRYPRKPACLTHIIVGWDPCRPSTDRGRNGGKPCIQRDRQAEPKSWTSRIDHRTTPVLIDR